MSARPPNQPLRMLAWLILAGGAAAGLIALGVTAWIAVPAGVVGGYLIMLALLALGERGRDGCLERPPLGPPPIERERRIS